jgi:hypothetical protein
MDGNEAAIAAMQAADRLRDEGSADFVSWVTLGEAELTDQDINARGTTDFCTVETRTMQQPVASAVLRDGQLKAAMSRNPLSKLLVAGGVHVMKHLNSERPRDYFYVDANRWQHDPATDQWRLSLAEQRQPGVRDASDPTLPVEALAAITKIHAATPGGDVSGRPTTRLSVQTDLRLVENRLAGLLSAGDRRRRAGSWFAAAPMLLWIDAEGLPRRISYAPLAPNTVQPFWWTIEFSNFGAHLDRPALPTW